ncbi:threonylcarbamoyl-AMP synthase [Methanofollis formosanus]|uniref:L-threonylcarbamoyladenylate synthase n=1 Tax=Methanofollis formosanus TaxID=299308 RepID=A0A8G1A1X5_9EURY|nr:L-threonylcarbamoyladenylate synthase [Methanofollis formosanus]QYZ78918.1 threonylcarbamoyl-AMP synthase [Methanofollis formosanus]
MDEAVIQKAVRVLRRDGLVVYPTDTIYGLGADALSELAVERVYEAKMRPPSLPVSVAVCDIEMLGAIARLDEAAERFVDRFLPGPVTVVLKAKSCLPTSLTGGTGTIGVRFPDHPVALALIRELDAPITATSANIHGGPDPITPDQVHVPHDFLIDGGVLRGTPSTVVDLVHRRVLRQGALIEEVGAFLGALE